MVASACFLKVRTFLGEDGAFNGTHLKTDAAVDAGVEIDPVEVRSFFVYPFSLIDAGHRTGIHTVGNALADIGNDRVSHDAKTSALILRIDPVQLEAPLVMGLLFCLAAVVERMQFNHGTSALLMPPPLPFQRCFKR